ncbi:MAG: DUF1043 family protein [Deltaproteobacteria bacterium]|nr:DUF1043 family protein [Deltaproteobacteria bacterium]
MNVLGIDVLIPAAAGLAGLLLGVLFARTSRRDRRRVEELEVRVAEREAQIAQLAASRAEIEARLGTAEQERDEVTESLAGYQQEVVGHFSQTSDLLKEMTLQYRNIYEHLAQGAETLCPDGTLALETHAPIEGLAPHSTSNGDGEASAAAGAGAGDDDGESAEAARQESPLQVDPRPEL